MKILANDGYFYHQSDVECIAIPDEHCSGVYCPKPGAPKIDKSLSSCVKASDGKFYPIGDVTYSVSQNEHYAGTYHAKPGAIPLSFLESLSARLTRPPYYGGGATL